MAGFVSRSCRVAAVILPLLAVLLSTGLNSVALAQSQTQGERSAPVKVEDRLGQLDRRLDELARNLDRPWFWKSKLSEARAELDRIAETAEGLRGSASERVAKQRELLDAIGAPPKEGQKEAPDIAKRRAALAEDLRTFQSNVKHANLIVTTARELRNDIATRANRLKASALLDRRHVLVDAGAWGQAAGEVHEMVAGLAGGQEGRAELSPGATAFLLFVALLLYVPPRLLLLGRIQGSKVGGNGTRFDVFSRLIGRSLLINLSLPAVALAGLLVLRAQEVLESVDAWLLGSAILTVAGVLCAASLIGAVPHLTARFGIVGTPEARKVTRPAIVLAAATGLHFFLRWAEQGLAWTPMAFVMLSFALSAVSAAAVALLIARGAIRRRRNRRRRHRRRGHPRVVLPFLIWLGAVTVLLTPAVHLAGYHALADWLYGGIMGTALLMGFLWYLSAFVREAAPVAIRRWLRPVSVIDMGRPLPRTRSRRMSFFVSVVAGAVIWIAGLMAVPLFWGMESAQLLDLGEAAVSGIKVGSVTLSLRDAGLALFGVALVLLATRLLQAVLEDRVFPEIEADVGVQTALKSGVGYVGLAFAGLVGLLALNVELGSLAIVFGALSVGIGFGLQAIVGNFISGLIMLVERPIKVGDWVVVKGEEGIVKRISVRATELQTFERSSVLIPNSELISGTVTNWTFKDVTGRVDIVFGVDYEADVDEVRELMLTIAREHPDVLRDPAPRAMLKDFGDSALVFELWAFVNVDGASDTLAVESELRAGLLKALRAAGISMPYPRRDINVLPRGTAAETAPPTADVAGDGSDFHGREADAEDAAMARDEESPDTAAEHRTARRRTG